LFSSGPLASPVTLAPKSARPLTNADIPPDFIAAFEAATDANNRPVDIDLTLPDTEPPDGNTNSDVNMSIDATLGNTADKPIELDLDIDMTMSDLFGDTADNDPTAGLFSPVTVNHELPSVAGQDQKSVKQENMGMEILDALSVVENADGQDNLFASFSQNDSRSSGQNQSQRNTTSDGLSLPLAPSSSATAGAPSPSSILASFAAPQMTTNDHPSSSDAHNPPDEDAPFDFADFAVGFGSEPGADMAEIEEMLKSKGFGPIT
jgi:hypothetical protein